MMSHKSRPALTTSPKNPQTHGVPRLLCPKNSARDREAQKHRLTSGTRRWSRQSIVEHSAHPKTRLIASRAHAATQAVIPAGFSSDVRKLRALLEKLGGADENKDM